jgi:D-alanine-D-alanine ligase
VRVAVLSGGRSSEHEVSLASGASVREGLASAGHDVLDVRLAPDGTWWCGDDELELCPGRGLLGADVVFPALHGPFGEDGTVQGLLELLDVAYVGAGVLASAVCMDKVVFKDLMAQAGVPQVDYVGLVDGDPGAPSPAEIVERLGLPCWVKPARLGSSVGIARVGSADELPGALREAFAHDPRVIVEASASGLEVECSVLGPTDAPRCSVPGEIVLLRGAGWYDYEAKYTDGGMELQVPARISERAAARLQELALRAFTLSGCSGLARADFFVDGETVLLNELNTMPGQTPTSVYGKLWAASGLEYPQLLERLCEVGRERFARERAVRF